MSSLLQSATPENDPIILAVAHTDKVLSRFSDTYHHPLDLTKPEHYIKLAQLEDFRAWEREVAQQPGGLIFGRYDIAYLCIQFHLKQNLSSELPTDQHHAFIDGLFPRVFSNSMKEFPRIISDLRYLMQSCSEDALIIELGRVRAEAEKIITARDEATQIDRETYNRSFDDAFHNPMIGIYAPSYYDMRTSSEPDSIEKIVALLERKL
jgi:hypothetical protein